MGSAEAAPRSVFLGKGPGPGELNEMGLGWIASERGIGLLSVRRKNYRLNDNKRHWRLWAKRRPHADIVTRSSVSDDSCEGPAWLGEVLGFEDEEMNLEGKRVVGRVGLMLFVMHS